MLISLCLILAAVHAARIRHNSATDVRESEAEAGYSGNPLNDAATLPQVAGNRSTTLLQLRGPPAAQASVVYGLASSNVCPPGSAAIFDDATCKAISGAYGLEYKSSGSWQLDPIGCYKRLSSLSTWFNAHPTGEGNSAFVVVCQAALPSDFNLWGKDDLEVGKSELEKEIAKAKAAMAAAIEDKWQGWRGVEEEELEAVLCAAIAEIINEARAAANSVHDQVFHHGYYRAVKADKAAKAAKEAADEAITKAAQKAKVSGSALVFKKLLEHTDLNKGASVGQLMEHLEKQAMLYVEQIEEHIQTNPEIAGLESFLEDTKALDVQVKARLRQASTGVAFDSEAMTKLILCLLRVMLESLHFDYRVKHETVRIPRALHQDDPPDMSSKMKSELGLFGFLEHAQAMFTHLDMLQGKIAEGSDKAG